MGDQLYLERFVWFDNEARRERFPNANKLGEHFEIAPKTAQRSIDHFRDRLQAPLEYDQSHMGDKDKRISVVVINLNRDLKKERNEILTDLSELFGITP